MTLPSQHYTPTAYERKLAEEHEARRRRFARAAAKESRPTRTATCERAAPYQPLPPPGPPTADDVKHWTERQKHRFGLKPMWFSIEAEIEPNESRRPTVALIQYTTALHFGIPKSEMKSARRTHDVVQPRQIAMYLAKTMTLHSYSEIGRWFGGRDHTTVLHGYREIEARKARDPGLAQEIVMLAAQIQRGMQ